MQIIKTKGRKKTTGRYDTREELCAEVWNLYLNTASNCTTVGRATHVSLGTVLKILNSKEGYPHKLSDSDKEIIHGETDS